MKIQKMKNQGLHKKENKKALAALTKAKSQYGFTVEALDATKKTPKGEWSVYFAYLIVQAYLTYFLAKKVDFTFKYQVNINWQWMWYIIAKSHKAALAEPKLYGVGKCYKKAWHWWCWPKCALYIVIYIYKILIKLAKSK